MKFICFSHGKLSIYSSFLHGKKSEKNCYLRSSTVQDVSALQRKTQFFDAPHCPRSRGPSGSTLCAKKGILNTI